MTTLHTCPNCRGVSLRHTSSDKPVTCRCEYHDPDRCGWCGWCRTGTTMPEAGRVIFTISAQEPTP